MQTKETLYVDILKSFITKRNIVLFFDLTKIFTQKLFRKNLKDLIKRSFVSLSKSNLINAIDYDIFKSMISSTDLNVNSEIEVFEAVVTWVEHDENNRMSLMFDLLKNVRLTLLSREIVENVIGKHPLCSRCENCRKHVDFALAQIRKQTEKRKSKNKHFRPLMEESRCFMHDRVAFMAYGGSKRKKKVYERTNDGFRLVKPDSLFNTQFHASFYYLEKDPHTDVSNLQWFSRNSRKWKETTPGFYELKSYATCLFMGKLYVFGGYLSNEKYIFPTKVCYVYDPKHEKFDKIRSMFWRRYGHSCVVYRGSVVVTGGIRGTSNSVVQYDHHLNLWSLMPDLNDEKWYHGSVAMGDKLYVIGSESCEMFDFVSKKFTRIMHFQLPVCLGAFENAEIFCVKNEIVVKLGAIGTANRKKVNKKKKKKLKNEVGKENNVYVYNTVTNNWSSEYIDIFEGSKKTSIMYQY